MAPDARPGHGTPTLKSCESVAIAMNGCRGQFSASLLRVPRDVLQYASRMCMDLLEADIRNADRILSAWQQLEVGEQVRLTPDVFRPARSVHESGRNYSPRNCTAVITLKG